MRVVEYAAAGLAAVAGALAAFYASRLRTAASVREVVRADDGYGIYTMDVTYDYSIDRVIGRHYEDAQGYVDAVLAEALPLVPAHIELPSYGCSGFQLQTTDGVWLTGRNYDFRRDTSMLLVHCKPKHGYGEEVRLTGGVSPYGHGYDRYETILDILCREDGAYRRKTAWDCLREASQLPNPDDVTSSTQWSVVFDHADLSAEVVQRRRWDESHRFSYNMQ